MSSLTEQDADLKLVGLSIWVHGWQYPQAEEYWDANWLYCTARCLAHGARVEVTDSFLRVPELASWLAQCETLAQTLDGEATLDPMEPTLRIAVMAQSRGRMSVQVEVTPDNLTQKHWFEFEVDQTDVVQLVNQLRALLERFPVRGSTEQTT